MHALWQVYQLLSFPEVPTASLPAPLYYYNKPGGGNMVSMGSFSKITAPGLRLGWLQAPDWILKRVASCGVIDSGGGFNPIVSGIVHSALDAGLQDKCGWIIECLMELIFILGYFL